MKAKTKDQHLNPVIFASGGLVFLVAVFVMFLALYDGHVFGYKAYGARGLHLSEAMAGGLDIASVPSDQLLSRYIFEAGEIPEKVRQLTTIPAHVTPLYVSVLFNQTNSAIIFLDEPLDMSLDGNVLSLALLPITASSSLAMEFSKRHHWDGLKILANERGDSPAMLAEKLGEGAVFRILSEIESRPTVNDKK
jgi:hypothetical protein